MWSWVSIQEKIRIKGPRTKSGSRKMKYLLQINIDRKGSHTMMAKDELVLGLHLASPVF